MQKCRKINSFENGGIVSFSINASEWRNVMLKEELTYKSDDKKTNIHSVKWIPEGEVKGIIQIVHGMTEHILRYEEFAEYFTEKGYVVVGIDLIGHGTSIAKDSKPMYFGPIGSWKHVVKDVLKCRNMTQKEYPNVPIYLVGFSLGSFVVRTYMIKMKHRVDGIILIGTGQKSSIELALAKMMVKKEIKKIGEDNTNDVIRKLSLESYNKYFKPNRTYCDWLLANEEALDEYINDELCGDSISAGLFYEMINAMIYTGNKKNIAKMDMDIPILLLSGEDDPVGDFGKGIDMVYKLFNKVGAKSVEKKLYQGMRHDILREKDKENVYNDIINWIETR